MNASTKAGVCDARRCKGVNDLTVFVNGMKLCPRHVEMLTADEIHELGSEEPTGAFDEDYDQPNDSAGAVAPATDIQGYIEPIKAEAEEMIEQLADFTIENEEAAEIAAELFNDVNNQINELEAKRTSVTGPLNKSLRELNSWFKPAKQALEKAKSVFKRELEAWAEKQESLRLAACEECNAKEVLELAVAPTPSNLGSRTTWTFEVEDMSKVPIEFMMVNEQAVRAAIKATDPETLEIDGIRIFQKTSVVAGRG